MNQDSLVVKIERSITKILTERQSLPMKGWPISEEKLIEQLVREFGDGDISEVISEVIRSMEQDKFILMRTLQGDLELVTRKKSPA